MSRIPYATLIATIMCIVGVGVFCGTMYRGATLTAITLDEVFHLRLPWYVSEHINMLSQE
jgi:Myelin proteolipid protein (PLP or lipophilin).